MFVCVRARVLGFGTVCMCISVIVCVVRVSAVRETLQTHIAVVGSVGVCGRRLVDQRESQSERKRFTTRAGVCACVCVCVLYVRPSVRLWVSMCMYVCERAYVCSVGVLVVNIVFICFVLSACLCLLPVGECVLLLFLLLYLYLCVCVCVKPLIACTTFF